MMKWIVIVALLIVALWPQSVWGAPRQLEFGNATVACPSPSAVASELAQIAPQLRVVLGPRGSAGQSVVLDVSDSGAAYRVALAGESRTFADASRNCEERARTAAVFVVATLYPPLGPLDDATLDAPIVVAPIAVAPIALPPAHRFRIDVDFGGVVSVATATSPPVSGGATLRIFAAWKNIGGSIGVNALSAFHLQLDGAVLNMYRVPIDFSFAGALRKGRFEVKALLGYSLGITHGSSVSGLSLKTVNFIDSGLRIGAQFAYWVHPRIALFFAIDANVSIAPRDFDFGLSGSIGNMPVAWLSAAAGITVKLR